MTTVTSYKKKGNFSVRVTTTFESKVPLGECVTYLLCLSLGEGRFYGTNFKSSMEKALDECHAVLKSTEDEPEAQEQYKTYIQLLNEAKEDLEHKYSLYRGSK